MTDPTPPAETTDAPAPVADAPDAHEPAVGSGGAAAPVTEKSLERQIRAFHWVRLLAELPERLAGSEAEREAGRRVESWLRDVGFEEVAFQAVPSAPRRGALLALHLALGAAGCAAGGVAGFALVLLVLLALRRELAGAGSPLARWLPAPDSLDVVARAGVSRPRQRVVLLAPLDTAQCGLALDPPLAGALARAAGRRADEPGAAWPERLAARGLFAGAGVAAALALGADGVLAEAARWSVAAALGTGALAGLEWARAAGTPGASRHASGAAALLTCAEQLLAQLPPDAELWCAVNGASQTGSRGVRALLDAHPEWLSDRTLFVSFEGVGRPALHYARTGGMAERNPFPPLATELARRLAASGAFGAVTPTDVGRSDGAAVAERGGQVLALVGADAGADERAGAADDTPEVAQMETVVRAADFAGAVVSAALRGDAAPLAYV